MRSALSSFLPLIYKIIQVLLFVRLKNTACLMNGLFKVYASVDVD